MKITSILCLFVGISISDKEMKCFNKDQIEVIKGLSNYSGSIIVHKSKCTMKVRLADSNKDNKIEADDTVLKKIEIFKDRISSLAISSKKITSLGFLPITDFVNINQIEIYSENYNDNSLNGYENLQKLTDLRLNKTKITGKSLKKISKIKSLGYLDLSETLITDNDLKDLTKIDLAELNLGGTKITDKGIEILVNNKIQLKRLYLNKTNITDKACDWIEKIETLEYLEIGKKTAISSKGRARLEKFVTTDDYHYFE